MLFNPEFAFCAWKKLMGSPWLSLGAPDLIGYMFLRAFWRHSPLSYQDPTQVFFKALSSPPQWRWAFYHFHSKQYKGLSWTISYFICDGLFFLLLLLLMFLKNLHFRLYNRSSISRTKNGVVILSEAMLVKSSLDYCF